MTQNHWTPKFDNGPYLYRVKRRRAMICGIFCSNHFESYPHITNSLLYFKALRSNKESLQAFLVKLLQTATKHTNGLCKCCDCLTLFQFFLVIPFQPFWTRGASPCSGRPKACPLVPLPYWPPDGGCEPQLQRPPGPPTLPPFWWPKTTGTSRGSKATHKETSLKKPVIEKGMLQASLCETLSIGVKHTIKLGFGKTNAPRHAKFCTDQNSQAVKGD